MGIARAGEERGETLVLYLLLGLLDVSVSMNFNKNQLWFTVTFSEKRIVFCTASERSCPLTGRKTMTRRGYQGAQDERRRERTGFTEAAKLGGRKLGRGVTVCSIVIQARRFPATGSNPQA